MKIIGFCVLFFFAATFLNGCGLFSKKNDKPVQQIIEEQHDMNRKLDSLKKIQIDKDIDSLRKELDSSSKKLYEIKEKYKNQDSSPDKKNQIKK